MISSRNEQFKYFIDKCDVKGKKIVEVGCGAGEFIKVLNGFPVTAYGIEHDGDNVKMAREAGLDVKLGFAEDEKTMFPDAPYNAFISLNFIEHQPRPNDYLQAIYNNTQEGAYGYITVPDSTITINSSGYYDLVRDHIAYYTDETMRLLIGMNGFEIMEAGSLDVYTLFYIVRKKIRIDRNNFSHVHDGLSKVINATVNNIRQKGGHIAIWGASHQCFTLLGTSDLKKNLIKGNYFSTYTGMVISDVCYDTLIGSGKDAVSGIQSGCHNESVDKVIEAVVLMSGLGAENCGCGIAHAVGEGIALVPTNKVSLHGEQVAFGLICQLIAEKRDVGVIRGLLKYYGEVGLPKTLGELGIDANDRNLGIIAGMAISRACWVEAIDVPVTTVWQVKGIIKQADDIGSGI